MAPQTRKLIQLVLAAALALASVRLLLIYWSRHAPGLTVRQDAPLNPDYYVTRKKLYAYDFQSAGNLVRQPVWVREGYRWPYYPYHPATHTCEFSHTAGVLGPLERLQVNAVELGTPVAIVRDNIRLPSGHRDLLAIFRKDGADYAVVIGAKEGGQFQIYADEMFFLEDPHILYKHWPAEVWQQIDQRQVRPGMNELQVSFSLGVGFPEPSVADTKVVNYPDDGHAVQILFQGGRAVRVTPAGTAQGR